MEVYLYKDLQGASLIQRPKMKKSEQEENTLMKLKYLKINILIFYYK